MLDSSAAHHFILLTINNFRAVGRSGLLGLIRRTWESCEKNSRFRSVALHVAVLPALTTLLVAVHLALVQRQGMSVPMTNEWRLKAGERLAEMPFIPNSLLAWDGTLCRNSGTARDAVRRTASDGLDWASRAGTPASKSFAEEDTARCPRGDTIMDGMVYCLVDEPGNVYLKEDADSHAEIAAAFGLDERACDEYRFDLSTRRLLRDRGGLASERAAQAFVDRWAGTPEKLMKAAEEGRLPKRVLASLLAIDKRQAYLDACAVLEKQYTEACQTTNANDPCLEGGCAMDEDEVCLQPLLRADLEYYKACGAEWVKWFSIARNRIDAWKN